MEILDDAAARRRQLLRDGPPCSPPGQSKLGKRPPLGVWLARHRLFSRLPWACSQDALEQWELELLGDQLRAAQRSVSDALRHAAVHEGYHVVGAG